MLALKPEAAAAARRSWFADEAEDGGRLRETAKLKTADSARRWLSGLRKIQFLRTRLSRTGKLFFDSTAVQVMRLYILGYLGRWQLITTTFVVVLLEVTNVFFVVLANGFHFFHNGLDLTGNIIELSPKPNLIKSFCQSMLLLLCKVVLGNRIPSFVHKSSEFFYYYSQNTVLIGQWALASYHQALSKRFDLRCHVRNQLWTTMIYANAREELTTYESGGGGFSGIKPFSLYGRWCSGFEL
nr:hypothetical protein Iba_chr10bCG5490 [Ipomoea batatas]